MGTFSHCIFHRKPIVTLCHWMTQGSEGGHSQDPPSLGKADCHLCSRDTHSGLAATDGPRPDGPSLLVAAEDLGDAAMGDTQLAGDDAGPNAVVGHLHYLVADVVRQGSPVDEDPAKLIDSALAKWGGHWRRERR